jgi:hypothetical protein
MWQLRNSCLISNRNPAPEIDSGDALVRDNNQVAACFVSLQKTLEETFHVPSG